MIDGRDETCHRLRLFYWGLFALAQLYLASIAMLWSGFLLLSVGMDGYGLFSVGLSVQ